MTARLPTDVRALLTHWVSRALLALLAALLATVVVPWWWCGREATGWLETSADRVTPLARQVARTALRPPDSGHFETGSAIFDGEWAMVTCSMTVSGLVQVILAHPELRAELLPAIHSCLTALDEPETRDFGTQQWGEDGAAPGSSLGGHAYLGYWNLALGFHRLIEPDSPFAERHDTLSSLLAQRVAGRDLREIETYPGEVYPPDIAAVLGSLALHERATKTPHPELGPALAAFRRQAISSETGLVLQALDPHTGRAIDEGRGSGTAVSAYFIWPAAPELSRSLQQAIEAELAVSVLGFGALREFPVSSSRQSGDIDSGPVILGLGLSASGFGLGAAALSDRRERFTQLYRSAYLFGMPIEHDGRRRWLAGGALGDAILLSMLTAGAMR